MSTDAIQPSHPLSPSSPPALNISQHKRLSQWVVSLHQVAKVLELQLQHQSFQLMFRRGFPGDSDGKESTCNAEDPGSIPGSGTSPGEGSGYPLQYFLPGQFHAKRAWWATLHGVAESDTTEWLTLQLSLGPTLTWTGLLEKPYLCLYRTLLAKWCLLLIHCLGLS